MKAGQFLTYILKKRKLVVAILLVAIIAFAFWLRIRFLGIKDLWLDEYFTEDAAFYTFRKMWNEGHTRTTLLFSLIMKYYAAILKIFTDRSYLTPFELRLPNVIYGSCLVFLVFIIVKRISNNFTALFASLLCATSSYLVYYSRDGRYYPFLLLWASICVWSSIEILSYPIEHKNQIKFHVIYMISGFFGMFSHYGFWVFFAMNNIALCLILFYRFLIHFPNENVHLRVLNVLLQVLAMAVPAFLVPLIVYKRYGSGVSILLSNKLYNNSFLLNHFSYDSINRFCRDYFLDYGCLSVYGLAIIIIIAVLLLFLYKQKRIIIYLILVRFGTFVLLRFIPREIIREALLPRYIIFVILFDITFISLFVGALIRNATKVLSLYNKKHYSFLYYLLSLFVLFICAGYTTNKVIHSRMRIYAPFKLPSVIIEKTKEIYKYGDAIVSDMMEPYFAISYDKKKDKYLSNLNCYFIGWLANPPQNNKRFILISQRNIKDFSGTSFVGEYSGVYFNIFDLPDELFNNDLAVILGHIFNTKDKGCLSVLKQWSSRKSNILDYMSTRCEPKNLIVNSSFEEGSNNWNISERGNAKFSFINTNDFCFAKISGKGGYSVISQTFNLEKDKLYKLIVELKVNDWNSGMNIACCCVDTNLKDNYMLFPGIDKTKDWIRSTKILECKSSGKATIRIQYSNSSDKGEAFVNQIKVLELRDMYSEIKLDKSPGNDNIIPLEKSLSTEKSLVSDDCIISDLILTNVVEANLLIDIFEVNDGIYSNKVLLLNGNRIGVLPTNNKPIASWQTVLVKLDNNYFPKLKRNNSLGIIDNTGDFYNLKNISLQLRFSNGEQAIFCNTNTFSSAPTWWPLKDGIKVETNGEPFTSIKIGF